MRKILLSLILVSIVFISNSVAQEWEEISKVLPIPHNYNYHHRGRTAVDIYENFAAVGGYNDNDHIGSVYVYYFNGINWEIIATLTATDNASTFGRSLSISEDYILVGALNDNTKGASSGSAYVFKKPDDGWRDMTETAKLTASDAAEYDQFGSSVGVFGDKIVIGAPFDDDMGVNSGSIYIFEKPENGWLDMTETEKVTPSDGDAYDYFGFSVDISFDYVVAGAYGDNDNGPGSGSAYIFDVNTCEWRNNKEIAKLLASDGSMANEFGFSVGISKDYIVVGAQQDDDNGFHSGSAYVFEKPSNGWEDITETAKLLPSVGGDEEYFGRSVGIYENTIVIGAYDLIDGGYDDNLTSQGSAYIFEEPENGWIDMTETLKLTAEQDVADRFFGYAVGISDDKIVVGAYGNDDDIGISGAGYIFNKPLNGWGDYNENYSVLPLMFNNIEDRFGISVSIDGNYAVVGSEGYKDKSGCAYVLHFNGINWKTIARLRSSVEEVRHSFGLAVDISEDYIVVGGHGYDANGDQCGYAYVYEKPADGWKNMTETAKLKAYGGRFGDSFGYSVSISGKYIVVGAPSDDRNGSSSGVAYVFEKPLEGWIDGNQIALLKPSDVSSYQQFGSSVVIDGDYVLIAAKGDNNNGSNSGAVYVFKKHESGWVNSTEIAKLKASDGSSNDYFGRSIDLTEDYIIVGSYYDDDNGDKSGSAYLYEKPIDGWVNSTETSKFTASDASEKAYFGSAVGISENNVVIGAMGDGENGINSGAIYIFEKVNDGWVTGSETAKFKASDGNDDDYFGRSIGSSKGKIIVGAIGDDDNGNLSGSAYIFNYGFTIDVTKDICEGDDVSLKLNGFKSGYSVQWQEKVNSLWVDIASETNEYINFSNVDHSMNAYEYRCLVDNGSGILSSSNAIVIKVCSSYNISETSTVCFGGSYTFPDGKIQSNITSQTVYTSNMQTDSGCDSIIETTVNVSLNPAYDIAETVNVCRGECYKFPDGGVRDNIVIPFVYLSRLQTKFGCDSIIESTININSTYNLAENVTVNSGEGYTFPDGTTQENITSQVVYTSNLQTIFGCDSIIETTVNVDCVNHNLTETVSVCQGESCTFPDGTTQKNITSQVVYTSDLQSIFGCDSTIETTVIVNPIYNLSENVSICTGSNYTFPDGTSQNNITTQVIHTSNLQSEFGCDSIIETTVDVNPVFNLSESVSVCIGSNYTFPDGTSQNNITTQVIYTSNLQSEFGCDSIIETIVDVNPVFNLSESVSVCIGSNYTFPDGTSQNNIRNQVIHTSNLQSEFGCDSIIETTVNVNPIFSSTENVSVCAGSNYIFPDGTSQNNITTQVIYISNLQTIFGCDSIIETTVDVNPAYNLTETVEINSGESYTFPDGNIQNNITSQVIYISNLQTVSGCDSIIETTVNVGDTEICYSSESVTICSGSDYTFPDGTTQNDIISQVVYESYIESADECDKIIETTVNVNPTDITNLTETICQGESIKIAYGLFSYTGLYGITLKNEFGCDSVIKLDLTVVDLKVNLGSDVSINLDDTLVLDAGEDFETYYWSTEESSQTIEIDGEIGIGAHIYNVRVTDTNSCVASDTIIITVNSLTDIGLINNLEGRVKVYPNPTSDKLNIEFVENTEAIEISLYDIIGNLLLQKEMKPQETKRTIQIPGENGVYFIRIRSEYSSKTYKIIKN